MAPHISSQPVSGLILLRVSGGLAGAQDAQLAGPADGSIPFRENPCVYAASQHEQKTTAPPSSVTTGNVIQDQIGQDGKAFLLKTICRF